MLRYQRYSGVRKAEPVFVRFGAMRRVTEGAVDDRVFLGYLAPVPGEVDGTRERERQGGGCWRAEWRKRGRAEVGDHHK
jgi:hypothetical protein